MDFLAFLVGRKRTEGKEIKRKYIETTHPVADNKIDENGQPATANTWNAFKDTDGRLWLLNGVTKQWVDTNLVSSDSTPAPEHPQRQEQQYQQQYEQQYYQQQYQQQYQQEYQQQYQHQHQYQDQNQFQHQHQHFCLPAPLHGGQFCPPGPSTMVGMGGIVPVGPTPVERTLVAEPVVEAEAEEKENKKNIKKGGHWKAIREAGMGGIVPVGLRSVARTLVAEPVVEAEKKKEKKKNTKKGGRWEAIREAGMGGIVPVGLRPVARTLVAEPGIEAEKKEKKKNTKKEGHWEAIREVDEGIHWRHKESREIRRTDPYNPL